MAILLGNEDIAEELITAGAETFYSQTDFLRDYSPIFLVCDTDNTELLDLICDKEIIFSVWNSKGETPLSFSANSNKMKVVKYLSLRQKNLDNEDRDGITVLMRQLLLGNFKLVSKLVRRGANINYSNGQGKTALHMAIENGNREAVSFLLENNVMIGTSDLTGETTYQKAIKYGLKDMFKEVKSVMSGWLLKSKCQLMDKLPT